MHYCNISLKNFINEILQYFNKNNDIALIMHQRALIQGSGTYTKEKNLDFQKILDFGSKFVNKKPFFAYF